MTMHSQIQALHDQFDRAVSDFQRLLESITEEQYGWSPGGSWSIQEILNHLIITGEAYLEQLRSEIHRGRGARLIGKPPFRSSWLTNRFINMMEPPYKMKVKAPSHFMADDHIPFEDVAERITALQRDFQQVLEDADGLDLYKLRVPSPVTNLLKFPFWQVFDLMAAHQRRHLWQIQQLMKQSDFPRRQKPGKKQRIFA